MTGIEALRARLKERKEKLSVTAVIVKACAWALMKHPMVNATLTSTPEGDEVSLWSTANIGVAVALDDGLIVPVVHHAEQKSLQQLQSDIDAVVERARSNSLQMRDMTDGTFTISNLGMYGVDRFTAIINPPQVAILAVGRTVRQFVPDEQGNPVAKPIMTITLSADHRVVDGAVAAKFIADLRAVLEEPVLMAW
jgi:pyruvate dehydrogenase E2 component (dihydrolipoamide acetyltransferase)